MRHLTFILLLSLVFTSCTKERLTGNGEIITESRNVTGFSGIHSSGSTRVYLTYGAAFKVEVKGSSNLVPRFNTRVRNNTLELAYDNYINIHRDDIEVFVTLPAVNSISLSGSGDVSIAGSFPETDNFKVRISGSANVNVQDGFSCKYLTANISGSGKARMGSVVAREADVTISGSGNVWLTALEKLKVRISGSGDVIYAGDPVIDERISGSGTLRKM